MKNFVLKVNTRSPAGAGNGQIIFNLNFVASLDDAELAIGLGHEFGHWCTNITMESPPLVKNFETFMGTAQHLSDADNIYALYKQRFDKAERDWLATHLYPIYSLTEHGCDAIGTHVMNLVADTNGRTPHDILQNIGKKVYGSPPTPQERMYGKMHFWIWLHIETHPDDASRGFGAFVWIRASMSAAQQFRSRQIPQNREKWLDSIKFLWIRSENTSRLGEGA